MENLNKEELVRGAIFPTIMLALTKWYMLAISIPVSALLYALSGAGESKLYRRLGIPSMIALSIFEKYHNPWIFLSILPSFGFLSLGYGLVDENDEEGSWLGANIQKFIKDMRMAKYATHSVIILGVALSFYVNYLITK